MLKKKQADLLFDNGGLSGFGALAEQANLDSVTIVRELVQNSLDAAREAGRKQAIIRFELEKHKSSDIPAFQTYKQVFAKAKKGHQKKHEGTLPDSAQSVVDAMQTQIEKRKIETLFVLDNGVGLNKSRMAALLADGISEKSNEGSGSYGYGHTTIIPVSDLRYLLYGGVHNGQEIAAGHAVLASFEEKRDIKGKDGYYIIDKTGKMDDPFKYPTGNAIPAIIKTKLQDIKEWGGSGALVMIPAFNHFGKGGNDLWEMIKKAAACNFFAAIAENSLRIEYKEGQTEHVLDGKSINNALEQYKDEKRAKNFLSGHNAQKAYETICNGKDHIVQTKLGDIKIKLRELSLGERSRIDLCRNGMHISNDIPSFRLDHFADYAPFHCLIMVDNISNGDFHRLIRKAEPPKHNEIKIGNLKETEQKDMRTALQEIRDYIKNNLEKLDTQEFSIKDVLNLNTHGITALEELPPRTRIGSGGGAGSGDGDSHTKTSTSGSGAGDFKRVGKTTSFRATPVQTGKRSYTVQLSLEKSTHDNEIRFALDEGLDLTCDNTNMEDIVHLKNMKIDGKKIENAKLSKDDNGNVLGIKLGRTEKQRNMTLTFDFALSDDTNIAEDMRVSLQAEMVQRKAEQAV